MIYIKNWISKNKRFMVIPIVVIIFIIGVFIENANYPKKSTNHSNSNNNYQNSSQLKFTHAWPGEKWVIQDNNISVMKSPEAPTDKNMYMNNLSTIIGYGDIVKVTATKGLYWKKVNLYNNGQIYASGWILSDTVDKAKKVY